MTSYKDLLVKNKTWATQMTDAHENFFDALLDNQNPEFLWIGCSDSRVPANKITGTQPGEIFVHRNIANLVITDLNLLSVLDYAVTVLEIKHVIVCGHYGCGGVKSAMTKKDYNYFLNTWLSNIKEVYNSNKEELEAIVDEEEKTNKLVELNVIEQVNHLAKTSIIQRAWKNNNRPVLHGWVYQLQNGIIKDIYDIQPGDELDNIYKYDIIN